MTTYTLDLVAADDYRRATYGVVLTSATQHDFTGRGIHNRHHRHSLDVWANKPADDDSGRLKDPRGGLTDEPYSFLWSPHAIVISAHGGVNPAMGPTLMLGDVLVLNVHGYVIGEIQCRARAHDNPHGVLVDTADPISRQHYIDTGLYLTPAEVQEARS